MLTWHYLYFISYFLSKQTQYYKGRTGCNTDRFHLMAILSQATVRSCEPEGTIFSGGLIHILVSVCSSRKVFVWLSENKRQCVCSWSLSGAFCSSEHMQDPCRTEIWWFCGEKYTVNMTTLQTYFSLKNTFWVTVFFSSLNYFPLSQCQASKSLDPTFPLMQPDVSFVRPFLFG